jgi:hypothetical protein
MKPKKFEFEPSRRSSVLAKLEQFCVLSNKHSFIEVTEWTSGEGWDITIGDEHETRNFYLTHGQLDAIKILIKKL